MIQIGIEIIEIYIQPALKQEK